jgi:hypothetical protein
MLHVSAFIHKAGKRRSIESIRPEALCIQKNITTQKGLSSFSQHKNNPPSIYVAHYRGVVVRISNSNLRNSRLESQSESRLLCLTFFVRFFSLFRHYWYSILYEAPNVSFQILTIAKWCVIHVVKLRNIVTYLQLFISVH